MAARVVVTFFEEAIEDCEDLGITEQSIKAEIERKFSSGETIVLSSAKGTRAVQVESGGKSFQAVYVELGGKVYINRVKPGDIEHI